MSYRHGMPERDPEFEPLPGAFASLALDWFSAEIELGSQGLTAESSRKLRDAGDAVKGYVSLNGGIDTLPDLVLEHPATKLAIVINSLNGLFELPTGALWGEVNRRLDNRGGSVV